MAWFVVCLGLCCMLARADGPGDYALIDTKSTPNASLLPFDIVVWDGPLLRHQIVAGSPSPFDVPERPRSHPFVWFVDLACQLQLVYLQGREAVLHDVKAHTERTGWTRRFRTDRGVP